jgi:probable rRNA maturation factor
VVSEGADAAAARGLGRWLSRAAPRSARGAVTIAIVTDARVKALNKRHRRIDTATDVLSFPAEAETGAGKKGVRGKGLLTPYPSPLTPYLGDIVIARGIARKQARNLGHSLSTEFRVLALHGLLHLLGYDHEVDNGRMARAEARLRRVAGLPVGLIARSS